MSGRRGSRRRSSGSNVRKPSRPSETTGTPRQSRRSANKAQRKKDAEAKANASKDNKGSWAALGIGAAAAAAITAAALVSFASSDGANITFTNIQPQTNTASWVPSFIGDLFTSTKLEISWKFKNNPDNLIAIPGEVRVVEGDEIDIRGVPELTKINDTTVTVIKVKDDSTFVVESKMSDVSKISIQNKGEGTIHTSFDDQLDQTVADTAGGAADILGSAAGDFMNHIGTFFFILAICIGLYYGMQIISKKTAVANNGRG
jgi:hypothetical protein